MYVHVHVYMCVYIYIGFSLLGRRFLCVRICKCAQGPVSVDDPGGGSSKATAPTHESGLPARACRGLNRTPHAHHQPPSLKRL